MLTLTSCFGTFAPAQHAAGDVWVAQPGTTLYWMNQTLNGAVNTWILAKDGAYILLWGMPEDAGVGFTMIKETKSGAVAPIIDWFKATGGKGNISNYADVKAFIQYMKDNGWKTTYPGVVSPQLRNGVRAAWEATKVAGQGAVDGFLAVGQNMISIIVMPIAVMPVCAPDIPASVCGFEELHYE